MGRTRSLCNVMGFVRPRDPKQSTMEGTGTPEETMVRASMLGMGEQPSATEKTKQTTMEVVTWD